MREILRLQLQWRAVTIDFEHNQLVNILFSFIISQSLNTCFRAVCGFRIQLFSHFQLLSLYFHQRGVSGKISRFLKQTQKKKCKGKKSCQVPDLVMSKSSRSEVFCIKGVVRNFAKFTGQHVCQGLAQVFSVNFAKFLKTPVSQNTSGGCFCISHDEIFGVHLVESVDLTLVRYLSGESLL